MLLSHEQLFDRWLWFRQNNMEPDTFSFVALRRKKEPIKDEVNQKKALLECEAFCENNVTNEMGAFKLWLMPYK